ncbi:MAG: hypothetical protein V3S26_02845 [Acidimicrobiia bacterium]
MTVDLERQLAGYGEQLGTHIAPLSIDELIGEASFETLPATPRRPGWAIALATALVVLLLVGGTAAAIRLLGPVVDEPTPTTVPTENALGQTISVVHDEGVAGTGLNMVIDPAGNPVLTYASEGSIWVARCGNAACSSGIERTAIAPVTELSDGPISVALLDDGTVAISYVETERPPTADEPRVQALKYARAGDVTTIEEGTNIAGGRGLAAAGNRLPVLAYWIWTAERGGEVVILACGDASCATGNTRTVIDVSDAFYGLDMTVDADGNPVVVYTIHEEEWSLRLARCADPACASGVTVVTLSAQAIRSPQLALDSLDRPTIFAGALGSVGQEQPEPTALLIACGDPMCDSHTATSIPQPDESVLSRQLALTPQDLPLLSWVFDGQLWLGACNDRACTESNVDSLGIGARENQLTVVVSDGRPIIAYGTGSDVVLLRCTDLACTQPTTDAPVSSSQYVTIGGEYWSVNTVVTEGVVVTWPRVETNLDPSGVPFIVYPVLGGFGSELAYELVRCRDPGCIESTIAKDTGLVGFNKATVAIPPDGLPVFAWDTFAIPELTSDDPGVGKCIDPDCAQVETNLVEQADVWFVPVIAVGADGLPVLVYQDMFGAPVRMAICADPACAESEITNIDVTGGVMAGPFSLVLDPDGLWAVAYPVANGEFRLARCADPACTEVTISVFDDTGTDYLDEEGPTKLVFGSDGLPVIAFHTVDEFKIAACHDPACSQATVTLLASHLSGSVRSLMVGPDGNPIIAYHADEREWLAVCETNTCEQFRIAQVQGIPDGGLLSVVAGADGLPLLVYQTETQPVGDPSMGEMTGNLVVAKCINPACLEE